MNHPQTTATELVSNYDNLKAIAKDGCLALCYVYCAGIDEENETEYLRIVDNGIKEGTIAKDCTVNDAGKFLFNLTGRRVTVLKRSVQSLSEIKDATPVRFVAKGYGGHWVVVKDGKIVFNPLVNSVNVSKGVPTEARIIKWGIYNEL